MLEAVLLVGHKHEQRVCRRMTGQRPVDAVTGNQSTDNHLNTDIDVRVTSLVLLSGRLVQLHLQAETPRKNHALPRKREGKTRRQTNC